MPKTEYVPAPEDPRSAGFTLQGLRYFLVVAEELSVTTAARRLHMTQPPLSQQIRKLERGLGCELFARTSRGMRLTPAGTALVHRAPSLLGEADRVAAQVRATASGDIGSIEVGCVPVACTAVVSSLIRRFHQEHPDVSVHIQQLDTDSLYRALDSRSIDVGILREAADTSGIRTRKLCDEDTLIALPESHRLAAAGSLALSDLADEGFILYSRKLGMHHFDEFVSVCRNAGGFGPRILSECDSVNAQLAMIGAGLGIGFVSEFSTGLGVPGVVFRRLDDLTIRIPLLLAWSGDDDDPVTARFIELASRHFG